MSISGVVDLVKTYAKQETVDPLKNAGRFLGFGAIGAVLLGIGLSLLALGLLRLVQTEFDNLARGGWIVFPAEKGKYTFRLMYSVAGGGVATFTNTGIWAGVIG